MAPKNTANAKKRNGSPIDEATRIAKETFGKMKDVEFFSSRVKHLYFYGPVSRESVLALKTQIREANRDVVLPPEGGADPVILAPRPIVVHVNSFGGSSHAMQTVFSAFLESRMPICTIVDGVSASASTILSAGAPYRIVAPSSASLFHEWSINFDGDSRMRKPDLEMMLEEMAIHDKGYYDLISKKSESKTSKKEIDALVKRDLYLNANQCIGKGFADRLLKFEPPKAHEPFRAEGNRAEGKKKAFEKTTDGLRELLRDAGVNHVTVAPRKEDEDQEAVDPVVLELDRILQLNERLERPIVVHFNQGYMEDIKRHMTSDFYGYTVPVLTRIRAASSMGTVVGVIDSIIDVMSAIPFLCCSVRAMYASAIFVIHIVYGRSDASMVEDLIENTKGTLSEVRKILSERTKLPKKIIDEMQQTRIVMNAKQCLEYGIVDVLL